MTTQPLKEAGQLEEGYYWLHGGPPDGKRTWLNWLPEADWEVVYIVEQQILRVIAAGTEAISAYLLSYPDAIISERLRSPTDNLALSVERPADGDLGQQ